MKMDDLIKWGLVAGAAWFLINKLQAQQGIPATSQPAGYLPAGNGQQPSTQPTNGTPSNGGQPSNGEPAGNGTAPPANYRAQMIAAAGGATSKIPDEWNFYHHELTGQYFNWEAAGLQRTDPPTAITIDQWIALMQSGMEGLNPLYRALAHPSTQWMT